MKICLIDPPLPFASPPLAPLILEYLGGLTHRAMPDAEIELLDPKFSPFSADKVEADLVGICGSRIVTLPWVYRTADTLRKRGMQVVLGGYNPSAMPEEAKKHADAVVIGEAESVWSEVLEDARKGRLKPFYYGAPLPLENLPQPLRMPGYRFHGIFTMRGCSMSCKFCAITGFYGTTHRYRPIDDVVKEVDSLSEKFYWNTDGNVWGGNINRAIDLFTALKGSRKKWFGFGDLRAIGTPSGDKLLKAARESGLLSLWLGCEDKFIGSQEKNKIAAIKRLKDNGIDPILGVMLGKRNDTSQDFDRMVELADQLGIMIHPWLAVPFPGTELYQEYKPFLLKEGQWQYYDGAHALFSHPQMSPEQREEKLFSIVFELFTLKRVFKHFLELPLSVFPAGHFAFLMREFPIRMGMKAAYRKWLVEIGSKKSSV
jgi:radical SAM superfamily enzyme YgiQ (UPF0313 family)